MIIHHDITDHAHSNKQDKETENEQEPMCVRYIVRVTTLVQLIQAQTDQHKHHGGVYKRT